MSKSNGTTTIPGLAKTDEIVELCRLAKDKNVVQLGCHCGRATVALAMVAKRLWVLDDFICPGAPTILEELKRNVTEAGVDGKIGFLHGDGGRFTDLGDDFPGKVDLVYSDANRGDEHKVLDQRFVYNAVAEGGIYAGHVNGEFKWIRFEAEKEETREAYEMASVLESK